MIIYKATNLVNGKVYIGQTTQSLKKRISVHKSSKNCVALHRAMSKHGMDNFVFEILEKHSNIDSLNKREEFYIKQYNCIAPHGYNLKNGGNNKTYSEISKRKMSDSQKGRKVSDKTRAKMSDLKKGHTPWNKGLKGMKMTDETKRKMKKSWNKASIEHFERKVLDVNTKVIYESVTAASNIMKIPRRSLIRLLQKQTNPSKKYRGLNIKYYTSFGEK